MSKFYEEKPSTEIIAEVETKARAEFSNDPQKAFEILENFLKEHGSNEAVRNKIDALRKELLGILASKETAAKAAQFNKPLEAQNVAPQGQNKSTDEKIAEIQDDQNKAKQVILDELALKEDGTPETPVNFEDGKQREVD